MTMSQNRSAATTQTQSNVARVEFSLYLLSDNKTQTLDKIITHVNAVLLFPDPSDLCSSSSGTKKYKASFICNGHWLVEADKRKEVFIGSRDFSKLKFLPSAKNQSVRCISPETPNYQNILNTALGFGEIQLSQIEELPEALHHAMALQHDTKSLVTAKTSSRRFYGLYKPEDRKRTIKKLLDLACRATAEDVTEIKRILDIPLQSKSRNLDDLRELLRATGTVMDHKGRVHKDRTLYQLVLGARDYDVTSENKIKVVDGLAEMLEKDYFSQLPDGELLREEQYHKQFPEGFEKKEQERVANESRELNAVMKVITTTHDAACQQTLALDSFHGFDLRPASWATNDNEVLASAIYFQKTDAGLHCRYRGLDGQVKTELIAWNQLPSVPDSIDDLNKAELKPLYLPVILEQLAESGEFYTPKQIQQLKVLSHTTVTASKDDFENAWNTLQEYIQNIAGSWVNFDVLKALYQLRNHLEPKDVYTTGYHSNPELFYETCELYEKNFAPFGNDWSSPKNVLCTQKLVGLAQRDLTACELQLWAQGPYTVLASGNKSKRSFLFTYGGGSVLPMDSDLSFRLGYNYFARGVGGWVVGGSRQPAGGAAAIGGRVGVDFLCQAKHQRSKTGGFGMRLPMVANVNCQQPLALSRP